MYEKDGGNIERPKAPQWFAEEFASTWVMGGRKIDDDEFVFYRDTLYYDVRGYDREQILEALHEYRVNAEKFPIPKSHNLITIIENNKGKYIAKKRQSSKRSQELREYRQVLDMIPDRLRHYYHLFSPIKKSDPELYQIRVEAETKLSNAGLDWLHSDCSFPRNFYAMITWAISNNKTEELKKTVDRFFDPNAKFEAKNYKASLKNKGGGNEQIFDRV